MNCVPTTIGMSVVLAIAMSCGSLHAQDNSSQEKQCEASFRWIDINRHSEPVLRARPGTWEDNWFCVDKVIQVDDQMRMYYEASAPGKNTAMSLGVAFSKDGIAWERYSKNPIWQKESNGVQNWHNFLRDVRVYQFGPADFRMYYSDGDQHIDLAFSKDGLEWENYESNPVLTRTQDWEDLVMQESILRINDLDWRMWYSTYEKVPKKPRVTGYATSTDGIHWTKFKDNPMFELGEKGTWDDFSTFQPCVFQQDGYFHMLYTGSSKTNPTGYKFGYAWSKDGIAWTKSLQNPLFVGVAGDWDGGKVTGHEVFRTGPNTYNIYYTGAVTPTAPKVAIGLIQAKLIKE
jgi:beta-1,2-mannobiose phosphorylase / 1,2-beta-oligomannan phosphorylase